MRGSYSKYTWHYVSFKPSSIGGLPAWPHELLHIVSPRQNWFTLNASADERGRYVDAAIQLDDEPFAIPSMTESEANPPPRGGLALRRYDPELTYRNGHILMTADAHGTAGGAPIDIHPNPVCSGCEVLMFHGATVVSSVREYGEDFVSVFYCEHCIQVAITGTNWN